MPERSYRPGGLKAVKLVAVRQTSQRARATSKTRIFIAEIRFGQLTKKRHSPSRLKHARVSLIHQSLKHK